MNMTDFLAKWERQALEAEALGVHAPVERIILAVLADVRTIPLADMDKVAPLAPFSVQS